jgi:pyruvate formate lyase activating enzyme
MDHTGAPAAYYRIRKNRDAACLLCPQACIIAQGKTGICRTRTLEGGALRLTNYGRYTSLGVDPIEKKPLYHFHPGRDILSIGGLGCNLRCSFCQNWSISHGSAPTRAITPEQLAQQAADAGPRNVGVAFTYNEPLIWFEFIRDCAPLLKARGMKTVLVSNGFINPEPFAELAPHINAMNIDLKSFSDAFYQEHCGARLEPVKKTIAAAVNARVWVEVTTLVIPGLNDSPGELDAAAQWLASVSPDIPLHLSRYFPNYEMQRPATPLDTMARAYDIAQKHLNYVYLGNVGDPTRSRTLCPECGATAIARAGYNTDTSGLASGMACAACGARIAGVA